MTRRRLLIGLGVVVALAMVLLGVNEVGNARAREELAPACECAKATVERTLSESGQFFFRFFGDDAGEVRGFMEHEVASLCAELEGELAPMTWNLGRTWVPTADREAAARVRAILDRSRARCPDAYTELLAPFGGGREDVERACDELFASLAPAEAPADPPLVWEWPSAIQRSMCLE